jgi:hypothetical protein
MFPVTTLSCIPQQLEISEADMKRLRQGDSIPIPQFSATIIDKLDLAKYRQYSTTKMTSSKPFDFETYDAIGEIPETACWFVNQYNQSVPYLHHTEYIRLKCQQCKKPVPFVLRGEGGCRYLGMPDFMESYDYTCKDCLSALKPE